MLSRDALSASGFFAVVSEAKAKSVVWMLWALHTESAYHIQLSYEPK